MMHWGLKCTVAEHVNEQRMRRESGCSQMNVCSPTGRPAILGWADLALVSLSTCAWSGVSGNSRKQCGRTSVTQWCNRPKWKQDNDK